MNEQALREFFSLEERWPDRSADHLWCDLCDEITNHRTEAHQAAEADRLADEADRRNDARKEGD